MRHQFLRTAAGRMSFSAATTTWLAAVEAADLAGGQPPLEDAVYNAKGVWGDRRIPYGGQALHFTGARTLAGALVPAVGKVPINVNLLPGDFDRFTITPNGVDQLIDTDTSAAEAMAENDNHIAFGIRPFTIPATPTLWSRLTGAEARLQVFVHATNQPGAVRGHFFGGGPFPNLTQGKWPRVGVMDGMVYMSRVDDDTVRIRLLDESEDVANAKAHLVSVVTNTIGIGGFPFQPTTDLTAAPYTWYSVGTYIDPALLRQWEMDVLNAITAALA